MTLLISCFDNYQINFNLLQNGGDVDRVSGSYNSVLNCSVYKYTVHVVIITIPTTVSTLYFIIESMITCILYNIIILCIVF